MKTLFERMMDASGPAMLPHLTYDDRCIGRGAVFAGENRDHRLLLERHTGPGQIALFVGVQPSRAGTREDDLTVRKLYGFGRRLGIGRWLLVNLTTYISPDVSTLAGCPEPIHPDARSHMEHAAAIAERVIVGWGLNSKLPPHLRDRWRSVVELLGDRPLDCWGVCQDGHPRHPGRIGYETPLERWEPPE